MKQYLLLIFILILTPAIYADDDDDDNFSFFGDLFDNLVDSIEEVPELFLEYSLRILNQSLEPFLNSIKNQLGHNPNIDNNHTTWKIITYTLSFLYLLLILYAGLLFITAGTDSMKKQQAKEWITNVIIMLILIQSSFYLYGIVLELGSGMNQAILNLIPNEFYTVNSLSYLELGSQIVMVIVYVLILIITLLFLVIRTIIIFLGVVLLPLAIFLYFIPPMQAYGKFFINLILVFVFSTFLASLILLTISNLTLSGDYSELVKTSINIGGFLLINILFIALGFLIISNASLGSFKTKVSLSVKYFKDFTDNTKNEEYQRLKQDNLNKQLDLYEKYKEKYGGN